MMFRSFVFVLALGSFATVFVPQVATAAAWSIKSDCKNGDWTVDVELVGFAVVDASCLDGMETHLLVDVGDAVVTVGGIAATSSAGCPFSKFIRALGFAESGHQAARRQVYRWWRPPTRGNPTTSADPAGLASATRPAGASPIAMWTRLVL